MQQFENGRLSNVVSTGDQQSEEQLRSGRLAALLSFLYYLLRLPYVAFRLFENRTEIL